MDEHILIVEDDDTIRSSIQEFLTESDYQTFSAPNAEEAFEIIKSGTIQIVITDILLPGKNGLQLTSQIKQNFDIDVIVMTGYSENYSYEEAINKGASDLVFKPFRFEELLLRLKRVLKERRLTKERNRILSKLENLAITDGLTKLYNLRHFYNLLEVEIDRCRRYGHSLALLLLDIDKFKEYNDTYGHLEGDKVLVKIPETTAQEANNVANRIRLAVELENFFPKDGNSATVTISIGVTEYHNKESLSEFIKRADQAMYLSKEKGRNTISSLFVENS
jgi:two-component system cell cycle response regulator